MNNNFEVSFSLRPAVREISRPNKRATASPPVPKYARYPRITQVVALALQFQEMIDRGEIASTPTSPDLDASAGSGPARSWC